MDPTSVNSDAPIAQSITVRAVASSKNFGNTTTSSKSLHLLNYAKPGTLNDKEQTQLKNQLHTAVASLQRVPG